MKVHLSVPAEYVPVKPWLKHAWVEGGYAFFAGCPSTENPYSTHLECFLAWNSGWHSGSRGRIDYTFVGSDE